MELDDLRAEAKRLRTAEPPKALRGFDEEETRKLLGDAAKLLEAAAGERDVTQRQLERLRSELGDDAAGKEAIGRALLAATRAAEEITTEAHASAERITADAESRATAIVEQTKAAAADREREAAAAQEKLDLEVVAARASVAEENAATRAELDRERERLERERESSRETFERERAKVLDEARTEAEAIVAEARHEVMRLQSYGERLRSLLTDSRRNFVELAESALRQLDGVDTKGSRGGELLADLLPSDGKPAATTVADD